MNSITTLSTTHLSRKNRLLVLGVVGFLSFLLFSLAYTASAATLYRQLQLGMSGSDVSDLQSFLARDVSVYPQGLVTGYFGTLTQTAVSRFQTKNGIAAVGRVGPQTMAAINAQMTSGGGGGSSVLPTINAVSVSATTSTGATISWNTTKNTSGILYYNTSPLSLVEGSPSSGVVISGSSMLVNSDFTSSHTGTLSGLQPNTTYYYSVYARDVAGNEDVTWPATFTTSQ